MINFTWVAPKGMRILTSISLLMLAACSTTPSSSLALTFPFQVLGNEPGWSVRLNYDLAADVVLDTGSTRFNTTFTPTHHSTTHWIAQAKQGDDQLVLRIRAGYCNDTMSDTVYAYQAELVINDKVLQGCGRAAFDL